MHQTQLDIIVQADQEQEKNRKNLTPKAMMPSIKEW